MATALKGNIAVGQSGGPTAVINSSLAGVIEEARKHSEITGVYGMWHGIQGFLKEELIDLYAQPAEIVQGLKRTPSAALGSCRYKLKDGDYERILNLFKQYNIRYFHYIGGNDSQDTSNRISKMAQEQGYELRVIGVPKTIDNDLSATDHCPGYGSVARYIAVSTQEMGKDTEAIGLVDNVKILEAMGRNAGWITAAAMLGKKDEDDPPHLIYVPERPITWDGFLGDVQRVYDRLGYCVIVVCEGLTDADTGEPITASASAVDVDSFGHKQMGGVADTLCKEIAARLKIKARYDKPGTIQRMSMALASTVDLEEACMIGAQAVREAVSGKTDFMVSFVRESNDPYRCGTGLVPLSDAALAEKKLPSDYINEAGNFPTERFAEYARPLIGGPLPEYVKLKRVWVPGGGRR
ncbi:MAG: 6-phosphofructokinase [Candidatus Latescibacterota bacterium]|nr:6-phosphofructokinase [Candidatus Latescibacterota bacterium]RKY72146.1 MAG: 6-phosphofructokinase [Candidatus Latescibacterota bacterium]